MAPSILSQPRLRSLLRRMLAFLLVANLPFWIAQRMMLHVPRGLFSLDFLLIGIAALYLPVTLGVGLFTLLFILDVLSCTSFYYYFTETDWMVAAESLSHLSATRVISVFLELSLCGAVLAALCWFIAGKPEPAERKRQALSLSLVFCLLATAGILAGPFNLFSLDTLLPFSPSHSALYRMGHSLRQMMKHSDQPILPMNGATHVLGSLREASTTPTHPHNIVLVLVESYGLLNDPQAAQFMQSPYHDAAIQSRYEVETGTTPFHGSTVPGEFRELCGLSAGLRSTTKAAQLAPQCLPHILRGKGYEATAYHGFSEKMFDRLNWYRALGFQERYFREELGQEKVCGGAFEGICDAAMGELVRKQLMETAKPQFVYWLTLNSHLPIATSKSALQKLGCSEPRANEDQALCMWRGLVEQVHLEVASIASDPKLPPTEFIVVGDHAPPFFSPAMRSQFSQKEVPFIHLIPREAPSTAPASHTLFTRSHLHVEPTSAPASKARSQHVLRRDFESLSPAAN